MMGEAFRFTLLAACLCQALASYTGCPLTEYECEEDKYHNGDNYLTEYGLTKEECGGRCCAKGWCVGFDFTGDSAQDNSGMCHLLIDLKGGLNENLEVSNRKTVHCQKKLSSWSEWSVCSASCGTSGRSERTKICHVVDCGDAILKDERSCNNMTCPGCGSNEYFCRTDHTQSTATPLRTLTGISQNQCFLECCGYSNCMGAVYTTLGEICALSHHTASMNPPTPLVGKNYCQRITSYWSAWSQCDSTCGTGQQVRIRACLGTTTECQSIDVKDVKVCETGVQCPGCFGSDFSCRAGRSQYWKFLRSFRDVDEDYCSKMCCSDTSCVAYAYTAGQRMCQLSRYTSQQLPVYGKRGTKHCQRAVGEWSTWATCSASCGTFGVIRRTRACLPGDGSTCNAILEQKKSCPPAPCSGCSYSNYTCEQSKEQKAGNFASIDDISLDACAQYCCQTVACTGYTYSNLTRTCKLSDQLSTSKLTVINAIGDSMYCTKNEAIYDCQVNKVQLTTGIETTSKSLDECKTACKEKSECQGFQWKTASCVLSRKHRRDSPLHGKNGGWTQCQKRENLPFLWSYVGCYEKISITKASDTELFTSTSLEDILRKDFVKTQRPKEIGIEPYFADIIRVTYLDPNPTDQRTVLDTCVDGTGSANAYSVYEQANVQVHHAGNWGNWSETGSCSARCGGGFKTMVRWCDDPRPFLTQLCLAGDGVRRNRETKTVACNPQICLDVGNWGKWMSGPCNRGCGGGVRTKQRTCNDPLQPRGFGRPCLKQDGSRGNVEQATESCNGHLCAVNGGWSTWSETKCTKTCNGGVQRKYRWCNRPSPGWGGLQCRRTTGERSRYEVTTALCNNQPCSGSSVAKWSQWMPQPCSANCGGGFRVQVRYCLNSYNCRTTSGSTSMYEVTTAVCNTQRCY